MVKLIVETVVGKQINIEVSPNDTVFQVKEIIEIEEGICINQQKIIYAGRPIIDDAKISSYNFQNGTVLHMVLALRAG